MSLFHSEKIELWTYSHRIVGSQDCKLLLLTAWSKASSHRFIDASVVQRSAAEAAACKFGAPLAEGAAGRDGIATEFLQKLGIRGALPLPPAPPGRLLGELEKHQNFGQQKRCSRAPKWSPSCTRGGTQNREKREKRLLGPLPKLAEKSVAFRAL